MMSELLTILGIYILKASSKTLDKLFLIQTTS
jgi:hypothetical protein